MGSGPTGKFAALVAFAIIIAQAHAATPHKREWKVVPGHKNIVVDMASVAPMWRTLMGPRNYGVTPPVDGPKIPTETTNVTVKLNGHNFVDLLTCSGFGAADRNQESTVYFPQTRLNEPPTKIMGHIPGGVVEALACPEARRRAPQP